MSHCCRKVLWVVALAAGLGAVHGVAWAASPLMSVQYQALSPDERWEQRRQAREQWRSLPPDQRQQIRSQMREHWQQMPPEQREMHRQEHRDRMQQLAPEDRQRMRQDMRDFRGEHWDGPRGRRP